MLKYLILHTESSPVAQWISMKHGCRQTLHGLPRFYMLWCRDTRLGPKHCVVYLQGCSNPIEIDRNQASGFKKKKKPAVKS